MIYLFDKDEKLIKIVRKSAVKTALQKYALTTERYVSDRLTAELRGLNADELEQVEYMAIQTMEDAHIFHYFYVAQKSSDELTALIGVQSGIEELRKSPIYDKRPQNAFARDVITDLLAGTNWQARFVGETTAHSTNFYYTSVFDALKKVCEVWDLEMQFFVEMNGNRIGARYIDFKQRIGEAVGKRVVYGHNALQILQEVERTNIFTALIGRGKGEETGDGYGRKITFENVVWSTTQGNPVNKPAGQRYLELPLMTREYGIKNADGSMRPKIGFVDFSEEENPEVLIERTYKALVDAARPQLTLKTSSVYLKGVKVGDTIRVVRHDKKLDYETRIFEITFNRLNNQSSDIKLGDRIGESNEAKAQTIADKAIEQFVNNEFSNFVQNLPDYLPSADGFNNNWYGTEDPTVEYPGKVLINDIWYKPDPEHEGHKIMLRWTGEVWEEILRTYDNEALRDRIAEEIAQVNQSMQAQSEEHDRQVADILSKTQSVEELANQAKTDAANAIAEAIRLDTIERQATEAKVANAKSQAIAEANELVETAKGLLSGQVSSVSTDLSQTKEAIKLLATKATVDALTGRISSAESTLQVQAGEIASRVKASDFDQAKQRISTAESSITQLGNRITTEISNVEGKIPTFVGGRNLIRALNSNNYSGILAVNEEGVIIRGGNGATDTLIALYKAKTSGGNHVFSYSMKEGSSHRVLIKIYDENEKEIENKSIPGWTWNIYYKGYYTQVSNNGYAVFNAPIETRYINGVIVPPWNEPIVNYTLLWMKLEKGTVATDWTPAPEDIADEISSVKTTITQTSQGVEQLTASLATTDGKVTTAETKINQLIGDVSSKVSQTDYNTLTGRVSSAETAITQNATEISKRLTSTQVEQAITDKGYATVAVLENKVKETADSFSRTISETKALIPTYIGSRNLLLNTSNEKTVNRNFDHLISRPLEIGKLTYTVWLKANRDTIVNVYLNDDTGQNRTALVFAYNLQITTEYKKYTLTKKLTQFTGTEINNIKMRVYGLDGDIITGKEAKLETGNVATDWSPAPEDLATVTALHNVTDTVDSHTRTIGAVGTTGSILDNVSKVTQTANGLVTEVSGDNGLKTQVSTLAGSYAIKSLTNSGNVLNQLNLNKDGSVRIDGKLVQITGTTYIQDGVISSAKIASLDAGKVTTGYLASARIATNSITGSHIAFDQAFFNSFMANEAYLKQLFAKNAFITSVQAVAISASQITSGILKATNGAMVIDLDNALTEYKERATIRFHSAGNVLYREKIHPQGHNTIGALMFKDSNGGGVMTALGNTSHQTIDTMRNNYGEGGLTGSFAGVRVVRDSADTQRDRVDIIADRIIMAHSTNFQESTNSGFYFYPTAVNGWWNLGAILQNISNKFNEHGWGKIGDIYNLGYAGETTPSQYT
ncbi:phage tail spike protein [Streptococcus suis]